MDENKNLSKELKEELLKEILSYKKVEKVILFGSRANKTFSDVSDIDIAIFAKDWSDRDINIVKSSLEENIKTPLKIDLVNFYDIKKDSLKQNILKDGMVLYESKQT